MKTLYYQNTKSSNLYFVQSTGERVKILRVWSSGWAEVVNKAKDIKITPLGDIKKIY